MNLYNLFEAPKRTPAPGTTGVMDNQVQSAASPIGSGTSRWESKKKPVTMMGVGNNGVVAEARDVQLDEISNAILGSYKKAASADASAADRRGDFERGDKRFKGIVKATIKQGDNDAKRHKQQGVSEGSLNEFAPGEGGFGPFKVYISNEFIEEFSTFDQAKEEIEFLRTADPKSFDADWKIIDGTGKIVWQHDPGEAIDAMRMRRKIQFIKPDDKGVAEGGAETSWSNDTGTITLQDILELTKHIKQINLPINDNLKSKLLHWEGNPEEIERVNQVTVSNQFPILIMVDEQGQIAWILDGNHRLHKAIQSRAKTIPAKLIKPSNLNDKAKKIFNIKEQGVAEGKDDYCDACDRVITKKPHVCPGSQGMAEDIGDLGYNVVRYYEKTQEVKKLTNWLEKEAGLSRNSPLYFDDVDLVYGNKTIVPGALINPKLTFNDLLTAVVQASKQGMAESLGRATPKMPKPRDPGHAVLAAKRSSGAAGQHTNKKRQALLQPKHQKPLTRDMDMNEDIERHLMQMRHAGYDI